MLLICLDVGLYVCMCVCMAVYVWDPSVAPRLYEYFSVPTDGYPQHDRAGGGREGIGELGNDAGRGRVTRTSPATSAKRRLRGAAPVTTHDAATGPGRQRRRYATAHARTGTSRRRDER